MRKRWSWAAVLALWTVGLVLVAFVLLLLYLPRRQQVGLRRTVDDPEVARSPPAGPVRSPPPTTKRSPSAACSPHQRSVCEGDDAWWLDSCGRREERLEACGERGCREGACVCSATELGCRGVSERGRCAGQVLRYCHAGVVREVDCEARGERCGLDEEGEPNCVARRCQPGSECFGAAYATCTSDGAQVSGRCSHGARCELDAGGRARCVRHLDAGALRRDPCQGCSCPRGDGAATCDDDRSDGGGRCAAIEVVAFLVADGGGHAAESEERVRADVELANQALSEAGHDTGLSLVLRDVRTLVRPDWLDATRASVAEAWREPSLQPPGEPFFVPVVFARSLHVGAKEAAGIATLPEGACPGTRVDRATPAGGGVILLSRTRYRTTLVHELGHYLGLCHTYQRDSVVDDATIVDDEARRVDCPECSRSGDNICDTPVDPGIDDEQCAFDAASCTVRCPGATPDAFNLMSYYTPCRRYFTPEQASYLRRTLARRRAAHP